MAIGNKMVLTLKYRRAGVTPGLNDFANVFAYEQAAAGGTALDLIDGFRALVLDDIKNAVHTSTSFFGLECVNLDNPADFASSSLLDTGTRTGNLMPYFVSWGFKYIRTTRTVQDGKKRFGLLSEDDQNDGVPIGSILTILADLATALGNNIITATSVYTPRIWRRAGVYAPYSGDPPVGTTYPDTFYPINGVAFTAITTQNTRKR